MKFFWALKSPMSDMTNMLKNPKEKESKKIKFKGVRRMADTKRTDV
ncbi:MAG: hypothetical protein Ct9H300mP18_12210 [Candidatus Neomarinimicrobiota bacterium]|nr:MAG: hypothetical protein Ct9H300mP18_12210 [Candidatus Neomarinimicrobiota bacterium]